MSAPLSRDLHVWRAALSPGAVSDAVLSVGERERAARFHFARDRTRFINAHVALREILAHYLDAPPQTLEFETNAYGKPRLRNDPRLEFNLAHSGDLALIAVALVHPHDEIAQYGLSPASRNTGKSAAATPQFHVGALPERAIGVDVEQLRDDFDRAELAGRFFAPREIELVRASPERFFEIWTRKEAFIKAIGVGVSFPLQEFDVCEDHVSIHSRTPLSHAEWFAASFAPAPGYIAAVVTPSRAAALAQFEYLST